MITQVANNKPSGFQSVQCDAGIPVSGRTSDTGSYQILKLNANGSLAPSNITQTGVPYIGTPTAIALVPGLPPNNTFLGSVPATSVPITTAGTYRLNPTFLFEGTTAGGISIILAKDTTNLGAYIQTLPPFNAFNPVITDFATGLYAVWHNSVVQGVGNSVQTAYNRSNALEVYLDTGLYTCAIVSDTGLNITGNAGLFGFYEFMQIA